MIEVHINRCSLVLDQIDIPAILRSKGFTQFRGKIEKYEDQLTLDTFVILYPTIKDLLAKQFKSNHIYEYQKRREILFRGF